MTTLAEQLRDTDATVRDAIPTTTFDAIAAGIADLHATGLAARAAGVGDRPVLPPLPGEDGVLVDLAERAGRAPLVLAFYRGGWCPYCNITLRALQAILPRIRAAGADLVAITPETPDRIGDTAARDALGFTILHDAHNAFARSLGLAFELAPALRPLHADLGIDLPARNGDASHTLPLPATYVIERGGRIAWAFVEADFKRRAEPEAILAALQALPTHPRSAALVG